MVLPFIKLAFIAVKQVAKPVAQRIKSGALANERFHGYMVAVGRRLHVNVTQLERVADGQAMLKKERLPVLGEKEALQRGSDCARGPDMTIQPEAATACS